MASFAVRPGLRNVLAATISPSVARSVTCDQPERIDQPSRIGPSHGPTIEFRWSHVQSDVAPERSASAAASRISGQLAVCGHSRKPTLVEGTRQSSRWSWTPVMRARKVTLGCERNAAIEAAVGPSGR